MRAQIRWDPACVVELWRRAVDRVFAAAGANAVHDGGQLHRGNRDLQTANHHAVADLDSSAELVGHVTLRADLGVERGLRIA